MLLALLLAVAQPTVAQPLTVAASTVTTSGPTTYQTYLRPRFQSFGYSGTLTLWISSNGIVHGTYRPDSGSLVPGSVTGGTDGSKIWLDIPTLGGVHIEGKMDKKGVITGLGPSRTGDHAYVLTATPVASH